MSSGGVPAEEDVAELKRRLAYLEERVHDHDDSVHRNPDRIVSNLRQKYRALIRGLLLTVAALLVGLGTLFGWLWSQGVFYEPLQDALKIDDQLRPIRDDVAANQRELRELRTDISKLQTDNLVSRTQLEDILKQQRQDLISNRLNQFLAVLDSFSVNIDKNSLTHEEYFYVPKHHRLHVACEALHGGWRQAGPGGAPPVGVFINGSRIMRLTSADHRELYTHLFTGEGEHGPGLQRIKVGVGNGADGTPAGLSVRCSMFLQGEGDLSQPDLKTVLSTWEKS